MIPLFKVRMNVGASIDASAVLNSDYIGQGAKVDEFEELLAKYIGNPHIVTVNSGTSALHLALHLVKSNKHNLQKYHGVCTVDSEWGGCDENTEVLTTPLTCFATNSPIVANGLKIKWVDVNPHTLNMDLDDLERKLSPNTKVIMLMSWGGLPNNLDRINTIRDKCFDKFGFRPVIIEDAAHAFGSKYNGKHVGACGHICCHSFQAIKHLTTVDGGCLTLPNSDLYKRAKLLRWYGMDRELGTELRCQHDVPEAGYKFHMNDVNASIGMTNMHFLDDDIDIHRNNSKFYDEHIHPSIERQFKPVGMDSACWIHTLMVDDAVGFNRKMKECGIHTNHVHERNDKYSCFKEFASCLPGLDSVHEKITCIPVGWWVTSANIQYITEKINEGW